VTLSDQTVFLKIFGEAQEEVNSSSASLRLVDSADGKNELHLPLQARLGSIQWLPLVLTPIRLACICE